MRPLATLALLTLASCESSSDTKTVEGRVVSVTMSGQPVERPVVWIATPFDDTELHAFRSFAAAGMYAEQRDWHVLELLLE